MLRRMFRKVRCRAMGTDGGKAWNRVVHRHVVVGVGGWVWVE
jgi:hypothetical protein